MSSEVVKQLSYFTENWSFKAAALCLVVHILFILNNPYKYNSLLPDHQGFML